MARKISAMNKRSYFNYLPPLIILSYLELMSDKKNQFKDRLSS